MTQNTVAYANYLENKRSNLANEAETHRSNKMQEEIKVMNLNETIRSNKAEETLKEDQNKETKRANKAQENIRKKQNQETKRANKANEKIKRQTNKINRMLGNKQIKESIRSNKANESIKKMSNLLTANRDLETVRNNAAKIALEYDKLKQAVSENAKDRANQELVAYIRRLGEEMATAGFLAMKGEQYSDEISSFIADTEDVVKKTPNAIQFGIEQGKRLQNKVPSSVRNVVKKGAVSSGSNLGAKTAKQIKRQLGMKDQRRKKAVSNTSGSGRRISYSMN